MIYLSVNKPVSTTEKISIQGFLATINNKEVVIDSISSVNEGKTLVLHLQEDMFYGGTIRLSVSDSKIFSGSRKLEDFSNLIVNNKLPVRYNIPGRIQAENYYYNNGMVSETCTDTGGGQNMGYANPNDYMDYLINITKAGYYNFNYRVASTNSSSQIIIRKSSGESFVPIDTVAIPNTGGWQTWRTVTSKVYLEEGRFTLRVFVRSGEFNINWFEGVAAPVTGIEELNTSSLQVFPNPADEQITVFTASENSVKGRILIFNSQGSMVKNVQANGENVVRIHVSDLTNGMYFLKLESGDKSATTRIVIKRDNQ